MSTVRLDTIERAVEDFRAGRAVVVVDDENRENEGDLVFAASKATPELLAFTIRYTSGVICVPMEGAALDRLAVPLMTPHNRERMRTAYTISVDARHGITTGISAADRAHTVRVLVDSATEPHEIVQPGHVFPLRYREGGVLVRPGHTEASVDLARLAGLNPAGAIAELVNDDGTMKRGQQLREFADEHGLALVAINDLIRYRRRHERQVQRVTQTRLPTTHGTFTAYGYHNGVDDTEQLALVYGDLGDGDDVVARLHSECLTGDVFSSLRCDCGPQLAEAMRLVAEAGLGAVVYLRGHEGRGIGIAHKLRAYQLQEQGRDTVEANLELGFAADSREYGIGAQMLVDLGITTMRLMTNNPAKYGGLAGYNLEIVERVPLESVPNVENIAYLKAKAAKLGHHLVFDTDAEELADLAAATTENGIRLKDPDDADV